MHDTLSFFFTSCQHGKKLFARHYVIVKASVCLSLCRSCFLVNTANSTAQHIHNCSFILISMVFPLDPPQTDVCSVLPHSCTVND